MFPVRRFSSGFTLIEVAVVLFIGGMLLAGAIQLTVGLIENANRKVTAENMQVIKLALQNYVGRTGRLPCPAIHTAVESDATFGIETPHTAAYATTCTGAVSLGGNLAKMGTVPWKTIGISAASAVDGWNNQISYAVAASFTLTTTNITNVGALRGVLTVHSSAPVVGGLPATGNQINACSTSATDNSCNLLSAIVLVSHGTNGSGAYSRVGSAVPLPGSARELKNTIISAAPSTLKTDVAFVNAENSDVTENYFDDIVMALTPADVLSTLLAQGGVKTDAAAMREKFRQITVALVLYGIENKVVGPPVQYPLPPRVGGAAYTFSGSYSSCDRTPTSVGTGSPDMQLIRDIWGNPIYYEKATDLAWAGESCVTYAVFVSAGADGLLNTTNDNHEYYVLKGEYDAIISSGVW